MTKRIHIENLRIRLPRSMRDRAQAVGRSIGNDIARSLAPLASGRMGSTRIEEISAGRFGDVAAVGEQTAKQVGGMLSDRNRK